MRNEIFHYLKIAAEAAKRGEARNFYLGCVGIRNDGAMVFSNNTKTQQPLIETHAEFKISKRLTPDSVLYVARILRSGDYALAKPCKPCFRALRARGVQTIYYTICNGEFGRINVDEVDLKQYKYRQ